MCRPNRTDIFNEDLLRPSMVPHPRKPRKRRRAYANPTTNREGNPWTYQERRTRSNKASRKKFLDMFQWKGSQMKDNDRKQLEQTIVEYDDIFARHRLDIGINNNFKVKLTPKDERPIYTQSLPVTINLKENLTVELALMHRYGMITTLPFSKYASPTFA